VCPLLQLPSLHKTCSVCTTAEHALNCGKTHLLLCQKKPTKKPKANNHHTRDSQTEAHDQYTSVSQDDEHMSEFLILSHKANKSPAVCPAGRCQHSSRQPEDSWQSPGMPLGKGSDFLSWQFRSDPHLGSSTSFPSIIFPDVLCQSWKSQKCSLYYAMELFLNQQTSLILPCYKKQN